MHLPLHGWDDGFPWKCFKRQLPDQGCIPTLWKTKISMGKQWDQVYQESWPETICPWLIMFVCLIEGLNSKWKNKSDELTTLVQKPIQVFWFYSSLPLLATWSVAVNNWEYQTLLITELHPQHVHSCQLNSYASQHPSSERKNYPTYLNAGKTQYQWNKANIQLELVYIENK